MKTIIFDFGNVVAFFDHQRAVEKLLRFTEMSASELTQRLYGSDIEDQYERGNLSTSEYVQLAIAAGRLTCGPLEFLSAYVDIFSRNPEVCELIPALSKKYRILLASNTNAAHYEQFSKQFSDVLNPDFFHAICTSHFGRCRKPEMAYFQYCQSFTGCDPKECLFLDDLPKNVEAASRWGWQTILYRPGKDLKQQLQTKGIAIS
jgi:putative hydrolase of the HAD superfamily